MRWEMTSSWTTPHSFSQKWSLTGRHSVDWLICLDKCLVRFGVHLSSNKLICLSVLTLLWLLGCGIGTGPGVIQDHYSPTMGRHRANPHYSDHAVNGSSLHQAQFDSGSKPFIKQNQVKENTCNIIIIFFAPYIPNKCYSQGQNSPVFNHKQNHLVQLQSKDMAPRFGKKGKLNADEVQQFPIVTQEWVCFWV